MARKLPAILIAGVLIGTSAQGAISVKNFREIYDSLAASTGVDPNDATISAYYAQSYTRLPLTGAVAEVSSPGLLTLTALSGLFCKQMITNDAALSPAQRRAHKAVDFTKGPAGLTAQVQQSVVEAYFGLFLSRSPSQDELAILTGEFTEAEQNLGTAATDTQSTLQAVCTSVASSLESLMI
jgi:hypothetical protein